MNKAKFLKRSILFATIGILALSFIPAVSAGVPGHFRDRPGYNNLARPFFGGPNIFSTSEDLYFRIGWATSEEEIENDIAPKNPWQFKLFINNEEIDLDRYGLKGFWGKTSYWYHVFGPGYFTAEGAYLLRFEFWVQKPYQGDGKNYWRIFVDYWGVYGDPGWEFIIEYPLNIVA
ncbi:hypothetical protein ES703_108050 [subsurface metagenome]